MGQAVRFEGVTKRFVLEHDRPRSFKEAFVARFRASGSAPEELLALDDVTFSLEHGGTLGIVGPNGTGKSTALKLAARILQPTAGRVVISGRVAALLELGAGFHPDLTGRDNVFLNGSLMGLSRREMEGRLDEIIAFSELERFIDMPVKHYSSGMYMRLAFATAIHVDPEILLIDEVLAVGDQAFRNKCHDHITGLQKAGITIVLVSHSIDAVREICERALWLENGRVEAYGPTDDVVEGYYSSVVAREEARFQAEHEAAKPTQSEEADRWGSGEVEIVDVDLLGDDGEVRHILLTGEPVTVRVRFHAHERIEQPVFGMAIHRQDGLHINGPNTIDDGVAIPYIEGPGEIRYRMEWVPLLTGTYELSVSCYDLSCTHPYDHHHRRYKLHVRAGSVRQRFGLLYLPARWVVSRWDGAGDTGDAERG